MKNFQKKFFFFVENAWVMTRERLAPGKTLQTAYGILDKYKISRTFFVKTDQNDCLFSEPLTAEPPVDTPEDEVNEKQVKFFFFLKV